MVFFLSLFGVFKLFYYSKQIMNIDFGCVFVWFFSEAMETEEIAGSSPAGKPAEVVSVYNIHEPETQLFTVPLSVLLNNPTKLFSGLCPYLQ